LNRRITTIKKLSLSNWASIAEVVGAIGVIVSLVFVVQSINRNTAAIHTNAEGDFLDAWREAVQMPFYTNERLAEIQLKVHSDQQLTPVEAKMWENFLRALFDTWSQLYGAYNTGVMTEQAWTEWDTAIFKLWERERMGEFWSEMGPFWASTGFGRHINAELSRRADHDNSK
jgi:hypothetical protein